MKKLLSLISLFLLVSGVASAQTVFKSKQVGSLPVSGYYLQTDGDNSFWTPVSGGGGGADGNLVYSPLLGGFVRLATTTNRTGLGTTSPYAMLSVASNAVGTTTFALRPVASQTANIFDIFSTTGILNTVMTAANRFGLGTTTPWRTLSVNGSSDLGTNALAGTFTATSTTATSTFAGAVGVATSTPYEKFEVAGNVIVSPGSVVPIYIGQNKTSPTYNLVSFNGGQTDTTFQGFGGGGSLNFFMQSLGDLIFRTGGANARMTILSTGNVGVGTTTPYTNLSVEGTSGITVKYTGVNTPGFFYTNSGGSVAMSSNVSPGNVVQDSSKSQWSAVMSQVSDSFAVYRSPAGATWTPVANMYIANTGNVGFGTTSPYAKVSVVGEVVGANFTATTSTASRFPLANITKLSNLTSNGFVKTSGGDGTLSVDTSTYESGLTAGAGLTRVSNEFECEVANSSIFGCLLASDWTTFNNKQAAGNYITALTGDVTASGPGSAAATLATVNSNVGSYTNANITVNAKGLITAASNGTGGTGGTGNVATSSAETSGYVPFWTSTSATPATLGSDSGLTYNSTADRLTVSYASTTALNVSGGLYNTSLSDGCLNVTSGLIGSTGSACGSSGGVSGGTAGMLASWTNSTTLTATGTPTAASYVATSSSATSTFAGGLTVRGALAVGTSSPVAGPNVVFGSGTSILCPQVLLSTSTSMTVSMFDGCHVVLRMGTSNATITLTGGYPGSIQTQTLCNPNAFGGAVTYTNVLYAIDATAVSNSTTTNTCTRNIIEKTMATSTDIYRVIGQIIVK